MQSAPLTQHNRCVHRRAHRPHVYMRAEPLPPTVVQVSTAAHRLFTTSCSCRPACCCCCFTCCVNMHSKTCTCQLAVLVLLPAAQSTFLPVLCAVGCPTNTVLLLRCCCPAWAQGGGDPLNTPSSVCQAVAAALPWCWRCMSSQSNRACVNRCAIQSGSRFVCSSSSSNPCLLSAILLLQP